MLSKSEKNMFYYLGLSLLVLIVLGVLFGVSSVKESFGGGKTLEQKTCKTTGVQHAKFLVGHKTNRKWRDPLKDSIVTEIENKCADYRNPHENRSTLSQSIQSGRRFGTAAVDKFIPDKEDWK